MERKGFTLVELLVVIAIIALLMGILMPALAKVRSRAHRTVCGANLSGIGKAMLVYAYDNEGQFPRAGGVLSKWSASGALADFSNASGLGPTGVYGINPKTGTGGSATVGSCFYLLVKYADVSVKQFVCKGDRGTKVFKLSDYLAVGTKMVGLEKVWDFGTKPGWHCSYAYHNPFSPDGSRDGFAIQENSPLGTSMPVAGDRNPYEDKEASWLDDSGNVVEEGCKSPCEHWDPGARKGYSDPEMTGNSASHQREGQNVLYTDASVRFAKHPNVGVDNDNIYQYWPDYSLVKPKKKVRQACGLMPPRYEIGEAYPQSYVDALLINDPQMKGRIICK